MGPCELLFLRTAHSPSTYSKNRKMSGNKLKAVIFGAIGAFSETSMLQMRCFNAAFALNGVDKQWRTEEYAELLKITQGGVPRLQHCFPDESAEFHEKIYNDKHMLYQQQLKEGGSSLRPDFEEFCDHLVRNDIRISIASTTHLSTIENLLSKSNLISRRHFDFIGHGGMDVRRKPEPDIYEFALSVMDLKPDEVVAIEDTHANSMAAINAGIKQTIVIPGDLCKDQDYSKARVVSDSFQSLRSEPGLESGVATAFAR